MPESRVARSVIKYISFGLVTLLAVFAYWSRPTASVDPNSSQARHVVEKGDLAVWVSLKGDLNAQSVATIASRNNREALLIEIIPEGRQVNQGDILARLDSRDLQRQLHRLNKEVDLALTNVESLLSAKHPLQMAELNLQISETQREAQSKRAYLIDSEKLAKDKIIAPAEVQKTRDEISQISAKLIALQQRSKITQERLHPAQLKAARAALQAAEQELVEINRDIAQSIIVAPKAGLVSYLPLSVGGEFRHARVGDSIYPNQPFMVIPDMQQLIAQALVPEIDIGKIAEHAAVIVKPIAYPQLTLEGVVHHVGRVAQQKPGKAAWQRYFPLTVHLSKTPTDLRPGLTVVLHVQTYFREDIPLLPRTAVIWQHDEPFVRISGASGATRLIPISIGPGNDRHFELQSGLNAGDFFLM